MALSVLTPLLFTEGAVEESSVVLTNGADVRADTGIGAQTLPASTG